MNHNGMHKGVCLSMRSLSLTIVATGLLTACGGGGDGGGGGPSLPSPVSAPIPSLEFDLKQLQFSWPAVDGTDHYRILENPDGASGFSVLNGADNINDTSFNVEIPVHKLDWVAAEYLVEACNADESNCLGSTAQTLTAADSIAAIGYIKASNTGQDDLFGYSVAVSDDGNSLAVGAAYEDSSGTGINSIADKLATSSGAVYLFSRDTTTGMWSQQAFIKPSNTGAADLFGTSVSLSSDGNTLAVGATGEDSDSSGVNATNNDLSSATGAVYVFTRSGAVWSQQAYIKASNPDAGDLFGTEVALSDDGNILAVGAQAEDSAATGIGGKQNDNTAMNSGAVYLFTRSGANWSQQAYIKASNTEAYDGFGIRLALSGDGLVLAVSAMGEDSSASGIGGNQGDNTAIDSGAVYVFKYHRNTLLWAQDAYIKASNTDSGDAFGSSVDLSNRGSTLAVGAKWEGSSTTGINSFPNNSAAMAGAAYVFQSTGSGWSEQAYIKASNPDTEDYFGYAIALSGDGSQLLVTAIGEESWTRGISDAQDNNATNSGAAYLFTRAGASWTQQAFIKAPNTDANDTFGFSTSLSGDGTTLAITAIRESSISTGINGDQTDNSATSVGAAYLY